MLCMSNFTQPYGVQQTKWRKQWPLVISNRPPLPHLNSPASLPSRSPSSSASPAVGAEVCRGGLSAINVYFHVGENCDGNAVICRGINSNVCCGGSSTDVFPTVGFCGIPTDWALATAAVYQLIKRCQSQHRNWLLYSHSF